MLKRNGKPLWKPTPELVDIEPKFEEAELISNPIDLTVSSDPGDEHPESEYCVCDPDRSWGYMQAVWPASKAKAVCGTCGKPYSKTK